MSRYSSRRTLAQSDGNIDTPTAILITVGIACAVAFVILLLVFMQWVR